MSAGQISYQQLA